MNIIKNFWLQMLAKHGLSDTQISLLVDMMDGLPRFQYLHTELDWHCNPIAGDSLTLTEVANILRAYFKKYVPPKEVLPHLIGTNAGYVYVKTLAKRKAELTEAEQENILLMPPAQLKELSRPLTEKFVRRLFDTGDESRIDAYLQQFVLPPEQETGLLEWCGVVDEKDGLDETERLFIGKNVLDCDYHALTRGYILYHFGEAFATDKAQKRLFTQKGLDDIIELVINQCTMFHPFLCDAVIGLLIDDTCKHHHLRHFLAVSYIQNSELLADLLNTKPNANIGDLLNLSQLKYSIVQTLNACSLWILSNDFEHSFVLSSNEQECAVEPNAEKRWQRIETEIIPRLYEGKVSPTMASWLVWQYPQKTGLIRPAVLCVNNCLSEILFQINTQSQYENQWETANHYSF